MLRISAYSFKQKEENFGQWTKTQALLSTCHEGGAPKPVREGGSEKMLNTKSSLDFWLVSQHEGSPYSGPSPPFCHCSGQEISEVWACQNSEKTWIRWL